MSPQKPASCGWPCCTDRSIDGPSRTDVDETGAAHNPKVAGSNPAPATHNPKAAGSNPAPATKNGPEIRAFSLAGCFEIKSEYQTGTENCGRKRGVGSAHGLPAAAARTPPISPRDRPPRARRARPNGHRRPHPPGRCCHRDRVGRPGTSSGLRRSGGRPGGPSTGCPTARRSSERSDRSGRAEAARPPATSPSASRRTGCVTRSTTSTGRGARVAQIQPLMAGVRTRRPRALASRSFRPRRSSCGSPPRSANASRRRCGDART